MRRSFTWLVSCSSISVCRLIKSIEKINSINFWWFSLRLSLRSCFWFSTIVIALMIPSLKSFSINGWESFNDTIYFLNSDKYKIWSPSKPLYKWWPSLIYSAVLLPQIRASSKALSKPLPSMTFPSILEAVNTTCNSPGLMTKLSISEFDSNCNALEYSCRSKVTMVFVLGHFVPGYLYQVILYQVICSKSFIFLTSFRELNKLSRSVGLPKIIGKLQKVVVGFSFVINELYRLST